jgi:hypothetical protein
VIEAVAGIDGVEQALDSERMPAFRPAAAASDVAVIARRRASAAPRPARPDRPARLSPAQPRLSEARVPIVINRRSR